MAGATPGLKPEPRPFIHARSGRLWSGSGGGATDAWALPAMIGLLIECCYGAKRLSELSCAHHGWMARATCTHSEGHRPATLLGGPLLSLLPAFPCCSPSCSCRLAAQKGRKIWNVQRGFLFFPPEELTSRSGRISRLELVVLLAVAG